MNSESTPNADNPIATSAKPRRTVIFTFLLGAVMIFSCAEITTRIYQRQILLSAATEHGRVGIEMLNFKDRDKTIPSAILIGGSDVREDIELDIARPYFEAHGLQLFSFAMSARDPENEKYEMLSALALQPNDIIIYSITPEDFMDSDEANPAALNWEDADAYLHRMQVLGLRPSIANYLTQKLAANFAWIRDREQLRHFFYPKENEATGVVWHNNGDKPENPTNFEAKLAKFKEVKNDSNLHLDLDRLKLEKVIQDRLGKRLILFALPRNPRFDEVYTSAAISKYYGLLKSLGVVQLGDFATLDLGDFYDINHLHTKGAAKFTEQILPKFFEIVKERAQ